MEVRRVPYRQYVTRQITTRKQGLIIFYLGEGTRIGRELVSLYC